MRKLSDPLVVVNEGRFFHLKYQGKMIRSMRLGLFAEARYTFSMSITIGK